MRGKAEKCRWACALAEDVFSRGATVVSGDSIPARRVSSVRYAQELYPVRTITESLKLVLFPLPTTSLTADTLQSPSIGLEVSEDLRCNLVIGYQRLYDILDRAVGRYCREMQSA